MSAVQKPNLPAHLKVVGVVLIALGALKLQGVLWGSLAGQMDPVFRVPSHTLALVAGAIEVSVAIYILRVLSPLRGAQCTALLGFSFTCYRWLSSWMGAGSDCPCLGFPIQSIAFLGAYGEKLLFSIAVWLMLVGSWSWIKEAQTE